MKNDTKVSLTDEELLEKVEKYADDYNYDFSNYYFRSTIWRSEYQTLFGEIPKQFDRRRKIDIYMKANTKEVVTKIPAGGKIVKSDQTYGHYFEINYLSDLNCIVVVNYEFNTKKQTIEKSDFFFVDSKRRIIAKTAVWFDFNAKVVARGESSYHFVIDKSYPKKIENVCCGNCLQDSTKEMYIKAFANFFPICFGGGNTYYFVRNHWTFSEFLSKPDIVKRSGPKQDKIDKLCALPLPKSEIEFDTHGKIYMWWEKENVVVQASRLNEEYAVLRWFTRDPDTKNVFETARLYVSKKDVEFCRINSFGEFIYINGKMSCQNFISSKLIIDNAEVFKGTKLEYFQSCANELEHDNNKVILMWLFSYYPIAEKMWKTPEYKRIPFKYVTKSTWGKFDENIKEEFGTFNANAKNVYRALGINAHQSEYISKHHFETRRGLQRNPIVMIKEALGVDDISFMDDKTFESFMKFYQYSIEVYSAKNVVKVLGVNNYPLQTIVRVMNDFVANIKESDLNHAARFYQDYIDMASQLDATNVFKPYFRNLEDICQMHDSVMAIYELKKNAIKQEAFNKHSSKWKKWEYDGNDEFVTIAPVKPNDLANEGTTLHHCVRAYIDRVADGRTNIMFIRKKSDPNTPFFTVEVGNKGTIEQVHGFANRNADTEPGLEDFVLEWAKKRKLSVSGYNKIR